MPDDSFLSRRTLGAPRWLIIAMVTVVALGFVPRGVRKAIQSNSNNAADWLPESYSESTDLEWFRDHFISAQFVLVSWDGCTLGDTEKLRLLESKLTSAVDESGERLYPKIVTGPGMIRKLIEPPANLTRRQAIERLDGALVGPPKLNAEGESRGYESRTTCLIAYLSEAATANNRKMRAAVTRVQDIAHAECGVPVEDIHMGGPPVDNITIDIEGEKTLLRLASLSGVVGLSLAYWFFRSVRTTLVVFAVAGISAGVSLAVVYWYGLVFEVWLFGKDAPRLGTVDAILLSMPAVVYVLGLSGAIHVVNYYRDERRAHGVHGAVERSVRIGWGPCALAAFTTAVGLGSLAASDIIPIKKFGAFTAAGVILTVGVLFTVLPVYLHVWPPKLPGGEDHGHSGKLPGWVQRYIRLVTTRHGLVTAGCLAAMALFALGLPQIRTSVQLLNLLDEDVDLIHDYAWLEEHLGNLVPMEVVVALTPDHLRGPEEPSETEEGVYRMTPYERVQMVRRIESRIEQLDEVSRVLSAATFGPAEPEADSSVQRDATIYTINKALEEHRESLSDYVRLEEREGAAPRELWRVGARVAALEDIDYGQFVQELRGAVEPVLATYRARDHLIDQLQDLDKRLQGARLALVNWGAMDVDSGRVLPGMLRDLLEEGGATQMVGRRRAPVYPVDVSKLADASPRAKEIVSAALASQDAVLVTSSRAREALSELDLGDTPIVNVSPNPISPEPDNPATPGSPALEPDTTLAAVYTGIVPVVYKTQRQLLISLKESILMATVLIAGVMVLVLRSVGGGLVSMLPNVFPIVMVFGGLGWLGIPVDIGIMMTASVALGVAVDDTIHFLTWYRRAVSEGLDRQSATRMAFERCGIAMTQTTIIAGLGLAVFSTSTFTPTQQFGYLMITMLGAALVGDLLMLPAILCGPLGWFFSPGVPARPGVPAEARVTEPAAPYTPHAPPARDAAGEDPVGAASGDGESLSKSNAALYARLQKLRRGAPRAEE